MVSLPLLENILSLGGATSFGESAMQITREHEGTIAEIRHEVACPKNFACCESAFENLCKVSVFTQAGLVECLEERAKSCAFSMSFADSYFCSCPLRTYIAMNLNR
jgi:hypothetical protein